MGKLTLASFYIHGRKYAIFVTDKGKAKLTNGAMLAALRADYPSLYSVPCNVTYGVG